MEEDIKKIEYFLDLVDEVIDENIGVEEIEIQELQQALRNLIKEYKELEEKNKKIKNIDYYNLVKEFEMGLYMPRCDVEEYYIPIENLDDYIEKSKVRKIFNDYKNSSLMQDNTFLEFKKRLLQEGDK